MTDNAKFIKDFVEAAKAADENEMKRLADTIAEDSLENKTKLIDDLVDAVNKEEEIDTEIKAGLTATRDLMKYAVETMESSEDQEQKDSTGEEAKDTESKAEEATQDVAADTSADETEGEGTKAEAGAATETEVESDGKAAAVEEEEQKTEDNK